MHLWRSRQSGTRYVRRLQSANVEVKKHYSDTEVLLLPSLIYQIHKSDCDVILCEGQQLKQPESWDDM